MAAPPDGKVILGGGQDSVLRIWDGTNGKALFSIDPPPGDAPPKLGSPNSSKR
jgi:hypothetical protein